MMKQQLSVSIGQHTDRGLKTINQDFHAAMIPRAPLLSSKGIVLAIADGISSSRVSQIASETAIKGLLTDYYSTPEPWSIKTSIQRVLQATNSWLYAQTRNGPYRYEIDRGYVCTLTALVLKSTTAHLFHVGDARVYRLAANNLEQLTEDHRLWVSREKSYLSRALGMRDRLEIDYHSLPLEVGDLFILATDGVYEHAEGKVIAETIQANHDDLDQAAREIVAEALRSGSTDNLSIQIVRIDALPHHDIAELYQHATALPFPPELRPRMKFDGYQIVREVHNSSRSHVYLAVDIETGEKVILKVPSIDRRNDPDYLERFLMEEWVAHRIDNIHVLKPYQQTRQRNALYIVTEFIEGQPLSQWIIDNPAPDIETVRTIVEQIGRGLRALHRQEMLHQDLRPNNILIDKTGTVKIIDFGSVRIAGIAEDVNRHGQQILGTAQYTAPEYFIGEVGSTRSDMFSLGVIAYQMLSGRLPYGTRVAQASTKAAQRKLVYAPVLDDNRTIPAWVNDAIKKAVHPNPYLRYEEISEFIHDLRQPSRTFLNKSRPPLMERKPVLFWQGVSLILFLFIISLLSTHPSA